MSRALRAAVMVVAVAAASLIVSSPAKASPAVLYTNPLLAQRADPHIVKHSDGYYYLTATVPEYDRIVLRRATTLQGLASAPEIVIWRKHSSGEMGAHIWAPEIHNIDGRWYIYFAAGRTDDIWRIRMYVLENTSANPLTGSWVERGRIATPLDTFSLDATTFVHNDVRYLAWAQNDPAVGSGTNLYLARMSSPTAITGTPVRISTPTYSWETVGHRVNEGPAVIIRNGRVFMAFSASATDSNYCIGLLTASATSNLLSASSWSKSSQPVFRSNDATSQYGPGHNSFTVSEDGQSDILVYHDRHYKNITGDPLNDPNRRTRLQKLYWNADGTPNFGVPVGKPSRILAGLRAAWTPASSQIPTTRTSPIGSSHPGTVQNALSVTPKLPEQPSLRPALPPARCLVIHQLDRRAVSAADRHARPVPEPARMPIAHAMWERPLRVLHDSLNCHVVCRRPLILSYLSAREDIRRVLRSLRRQLR